MLTPNRCGWLLAGTLLAGLWSTVGLVAQVPATIPLSIEQATARALAVSPAVAAAIGELRGPRGLRAEARWPFPDNPVLEYGRVRRQAGLGATYDREWAVSQEIEIAGQWLVRGSAAAALIRSAESRVDDARRRVALETRLAYVTLAIAQDRAALTDSAGVFAERLAGFARRQFDAGEANRLELNAAVLEAARARSSAERSRAEAEAAASNLSRLLALPIDSVPHAASLPAPPDLTWVSDSTLHTMARVRRPDLRASEELLQGAAKTVTAARRQLVPNLTVAAVGGREADTDNLFGFALGIRIPLFRRQQAGIGAAEAERAAASAALRATRREVAGEVSAAGARFTRARAAERRFASDVLRAAAENVSLTERALAEGEVSLTEVLVLRTTGVGAQLEYLDVLRDVFTAWFELAAAVAAEPAELAILLARSP